jgi:hypothetical protein
MNREGKESNFLQSLRFMKLIQVLIISQVSFGCSNEILELVLSFS